MAAKPPKPPGNYLNKSNNNNAKETPSNETETGTNNNCPRTNETRGAKDSLVENTGLNCNSGSESNVIGNGSSDNSYSNVTKPSCSCTNINIMHLFHEMKQIFPTIPDPIVTQCVSENCHQRENCIRMLRNELTLNPIPVQSYPAKVLHPPQQRQTQLPQAQQQQQQKAAEGTSVQKPPTPLKPTRVAPAFPPIKAFSVNSKSYPKQNQNCDSVETTKIYNNKLKDVKHTNSAGESTSDMPAPTTAATTTTTKSYTGVNSISETNQNPNCENDYARYNHNSPTPTSPPPIVPPRARPTTLNLQTQQQQQQRQQLNIQLQRHFQQQQQQQKPLRKAPLPPLLQKSAQVATSASATSTASSPLYHSSASHSQQDSLSADSPILVSPLSSGESEISVNVSLSSPTQQKQLHQQQYQQPQLKSPIRHRSVITVQPEPPYARDFLGSPTSGSTGPSTPSGGSNSAIASGAQPKSFTSVNLTLRQPNLSVPQSTIDISAGPGLSGIGGGLTYSSTSYDARRGFQNNFHITVTGEGSVFSASRVRPRSCYYPSGQQELDGGGDFPAVGDTSRVHALRATSSEQNVVSNHQYQQQPQYQQQQQLQTHTVATYNNTPYADMCLPRELDDSSVILERQKARRDKLATALRDNKKRLNQIEQEINILTEPVSVGESERLDSDIERLRCDCQTMLNEIENARRCGPSIANSQTNNSVNSRQPAQQPQAFPRQRSAPSNITEMPATLTHSPNNPPPSYQEYCQQYQRDLEVADDGDYSDSNTDGGGGIIDDDDDEEPLEMWACNMCTFRNHPQLNICECCENVRILPGTIRIVSASCPGATGTAVVDTTAAGSPAATDGSLENDANLTQQQLQQFALHT